jgi:hypothetical protein
MRLAEKLDWKGLTTVPLLHNVICSVTTIVDGEWMNISKKAVLVYLEIRGWTS